jgi:putative transport protein
LTGLIHSHARCAAGGLLLSGIVVSSVVARFRFFVNTPNSVRDLIEELGLITFVARAVLPIVVWAIGDRFFKINPAVLTGGAAGARSHFGLACEAAVEIGSSVPWIGFPVGHAVSGVLLAVFGYFAMLLSL